LDQVKQYYAQTLCPDMMVGKVGPAQVTQVVAQAFGNWQAQGVWPEVEYAAVPEDRPDQFNLPNTSASLASVHLPQTIDVTRNDQARYALNQGQEVLGGGFHASRRYYDLRGKRGLIYSLTIRFDLHTHRGTYTVSSGANPGKIAAASKQDCGAGSEKDAAYGGYRQRAEARQRHPVAANPDASSPD